MMSIEILIPGGVMKNKYLYISLIMLFSYAHITLTIDAVTRKNDILRILSAWQNAAKELSKKRESVVALFKEKKIDRTSAQSEINRIKAQVETEKNTAQSIINLLISQPSNVDLSAVTIENANIEDLAEKLALG